MHAGDSKRRPPTTPIGAVWDPSWAGWHSLRHTFASIQLARGVNVVQLSRVLGHHSAAFTLSVYVHLLEGEEAPPLDMSEALPAVVDRPTLVGASL
jgi:hypothetical protein